MPLRVIQRKPINFGTPPLGARTINVPQIPQQQTQWCWAACADMVLHYYGNTEVQQCDFANWLFGLSGCCSSPSSELCNRPCRVADVSGVYSNWSIRGTPMNRTVSFSTLQSEINAGRPVEVAYQWRGGGGHVAIICGWDTNSTGPFVRVNDPAYGSGGVYYSELLNAYGLLKFGQFTSWMAG